MKELLQGLQIDREQPRPSAVTPPRSRGWAGRLALSGAVLAIALMTPWWYFSRTKEAPTHPSTVAVPAGPDTPAPALTAAGYVRAARIVYVVPRVAGRIASLHVQEGDDVRAGDVIAVIDGRDLQQEVDEARAGDALAQANLRTLEAGSRLEEIGQARAEVQAVALATEKAARDLARARTLFDAGALSARDLDHAATASQVEEKNLESARQVLARLEAGPRTEEIEAAKAARAATRARLISANNRLGYARVVAPTAGRVLRKFRNAGDFVSPDIPYIEGSATIAAGSPIVLLGDVDHQEVSVDINETDIARVSLHQAVEISPNAYPAEVAHGLVTRVSPRADRNKNTIEVTVSLQKPAKVLPYDTSVKLRFASQGRDAR